MKGPNKSIKKKKKSQHLKLLIPYVYAYYRCGIYLLWINYPLNFDNSFAIKLTIPKCAIVK